MIDSRVVPLKTPSQAPDIQAEVRLYDGKNGLCAFADVEISVGAEGVIRISGFCIFRDGGVLPPAREGKKRSFPIAHLSGPIWERVKVAVLDAYQRRRQ